VKCYVVLAYRWGNSNDHWYWIYAGPDAVKASAMCQAERDSRGGKYGCAVYETNEGGDEWELVEYCGSGKEDEPQHNWRLDYFERLGHVLEDYANGFIYVPAAEPDEHGLRTLTRKLIEPIPELVEEVVRQSNLFKSMKEVDQAGRAEAKERREKIQCAFCDAWPVYEVEYALEVWRVPRAADSGTLTVDELRGTYCRSCNQLWQRADQIGFNHMRIHMARNKEPIDERVAG
jgi:hypothetical protein